MVQKRVVLRFSSESAEKPVIYKLIKDFDLIVNILRAEINPNKEGYLVLELSGDLDQYEKGLKYLKDIYVAVDTLKQEIAWDEEKCTECGACTSLCPTSALNISRPSMNVNFDEGKCIVCGMCVKICPAKAVVAKF